MHYDDFYIIFASAVSAVQIDRYVYDSAVFTATCPKNMINRLCIYLYDNLGWPVGDCWLRACVDKDAIACVHKGGGGGGNHVESTCCTRYG